MNKNFLSIRQKTIHPRTEVHGLLAQDVTLRAKAHGVPFRREKSFLIGLVMGVLIMSVGFSGCENLQKKFRRQKKSKDIEEANFVPILEPEDYGAKANSLEESYRFRYSLVKAWYKDIYAAIEAKNSDKRQRSTIKEIVKQMDIMQKLLVDDRAVVLGGLKARLINLDVLFNEPEPLINYSRVTSELHEVEKVLRHQFKPDLVRGSFRAAALNP